jgi:hypothetical protein
MKCYIIKWETASLNNVLSNEHKARLMDESKQLFVSIIFGAIGFYNEANTLESCSILTYSQSIAGLYTQRGQKDAV